MTSQKVGRAEIMVIFGAGVQIQTDYYNLLVPVQKCSEEIQVP